jgi:non-heme chloroperoxidase
VQHGLQDGTLGGSQPGSTTEREEVVKGTMTMSDGTEIYDKDSGTGQPVVFSHGWPLCADESQ